MTQNYRVDASFPSSKVINVPMDDAKKSQPYSLSDLMMGDTSGTTESDSKTAPKDGGYTKINSK